MNASIFVVLAQKPGRQRREFMDSCGVGETNITFLWPQMIAKWKWLWNQEEFVLGVGVQFRQTLSFHPQASTQQGHNGVVSRTDYL